MSVNPLPLESVHHVRDTCLCLATQRAARILARRFDRVFQHLGITNQQFSLMMALSGPKAPSLSRLAPFLGMDRTTVTAALKGLERRGLARVVPDDKDRRKRRSQLTDHGRATLAAALPIWRDEHAALDAELAAATASALRAGLTAITIQPEGKP